MLTSKIRTVIAVLGAALTVTISTAAVVAPNALASKNIGCNIACQQAIGKQLVIGTTPCADLNKAYNNALASIQWYSVAGDYASSVNSAFDATRLYNQAKDDGCGWAA